MSADLAAGPAADSAAPEAVPGWDAAWSAALADLELAADDAERLLASAHLPPTAEVARVAAWQPPVGLGPLPLGLRARAQALLERQIDLARRTADAARVSRRQARATDALSSRGPALPVYLDAEG